MFLFVIYWFKFNSINSNDMKKLLMYFGIAFVTFSSTSCATVWGGQLTSYQMTRPLPGYPRRELQIAPLMGNIFLTGGIGLIIDFSTEAIYRPEPRPMFKREGRPRQPKW